MTEKEIEKELLKIGNQQIKKLLPDYHGYIKFNLCKERKTVMVTKHKTLY